MTRFTRSVHRSAFAGALIALAVNPAAIPAVADEVAADSQSYEWAQTVGRFLGAVLGDGEFETEEEPPSPLLGLAAPDFDLATLGDDRVKLADLRGKIVVLDFWATWCGPCVASMPKLQALHEAIGDDVVVVGVNVSDERDTVAEFIDKRGLTFQQLLDPDWSIGTEYGVDGIPQTVLIDRKGIVQAVHSGYSSDLQEELTKQIGQLRQGETLYDAEAVAEKRQQAEARLADLRERMGPVNEERLQEIEFHEFGKEAYFDGDGGPHRLTTPAGVPALALSIGQNRILLVADDGSPPQVTQLDWGSDTVDKDGDPFQLSGFTPLTDDEGLKWAASVTLYDDEWDTVGFRVALFDADGEAVWKVDEPAEGDYSNITLAAGDLDGDGLPEIATLAEHYGKFTITGSETYLHVLSVRDRAGNLLSRRWIPTDDGTAVFIVPHPDGPRLWVNTRGGAAVYRFLADSQ